MKPIKRLVRSYVREATLLSNVGAEVSFQLPNDASGTFEAMLTELDARKAELAITRLEVLTNSFRLYDRSFGDQSITAWISSSHIVEEHTL